LQIAHLFRGLTAAASLKRVRHQAVILTKGALPRPHRRGLIEAGQLRLARMTLAGNLFRGLTAAASLKLSGYLTAWAVWAQSLPRPHRRGLIEAQMIAMPAAPDPPALPRPHRRGLIEACRSRQTQPQRTRLFRGLTAAASLKHWTDLKHIVGGKTLPRPRRRGLIEAVRPRCAPRAFLRSLPRPHRRGL